MSTAAATDNLSRVSHTGGTASGFQARIIDHCLTRGIEISNSKARKLSIRLARRMEAMSTEFDFYESLRILGMTTDTTARQAEHRATCRKLECDTCGRNAR